MSVDSERLGDTPSPISWTTAARWSTMICALWLLVTAAWVWLDYHGEPWLWFALVTELTPPVVVGAGSILVWRGRGWARRIGWGILIFWIALFVEHLVRERIG